MIRKGEAERHLRDRLFYRMVKNLQDSIRYLYDDRNISYIQLLVTTQKVKTEDIVTKTVISKSRVLNTSQGDEMEALSKQITNLMLMVQGRKGQPKGQRRTSNKEDNAQISPNGEKDSQNSHPPCNRTSPKTTYYGGRKI